MTYRVVGTLRLQAAGTRAQRVRTFPAGRVCDAPGCATLLSAYNPGSRCALHGQSGPRPYQRRHEPRLAERACEECGVVFETGNSRRRFCSDKCRAAGFQHRKSRGRRSQGAALG